jgi:hypothetical protein
MASVLFLASLRPSGIRERLLPSPEFGRAGPHSRLDERSYFSEFFFAEHTFIAEIFVFDERSFPIATIVNLPQPPRPDHDDRTGPSRHDQGQHDRGDQERWHGSTTPHRDRSAAGTQDRTPRNARSATPTRGLWQAVSGRVQQKTAQIPLFPQFCSGITEKPRERFPEGPEPPQFSDCKEND